MHTEHLENVKPGRVLAGWLVAVAVTSLVLLVFAALGLVDAEGGEGGYGRSIAALSIGFFAGGWFLGSRALVAPILNGVALALTSVIAWWVVNFTVDALFPDRRLWEALTPTLAAGVLLVKIAVSVAGALVGYNMARRGKISLSEAE